MTQIKSYTDLEQSKVLAKMLPLESADMYYEPPVGFGTEQSEVKVGDIKYAHPKSIPCWSLAALFSVLPEIDDTSLILEKVKAENYYHIEYEDKILIPYSKNPIDACYEMILKLHELKML